MASVRTTHPSFAAYLDDHEGAATLAARLREAPTTRMCGTNFPEDWILLVFATSDPVRSGRVGLIEQSASRHTYRIELHSPDQVDDQVRGWLRRAYAFGRRE